MALTLPRQSLPYIRVNAADTVTAVIAGLNFGKRSDDGNSSTAWRRHYPRFTPLSRRSLWRCTPLPDLGASVIKIESPQGDMLRQFPSSLAGDSRFFLGTNRGKRGVAHDLKQPAGLAVLHRMVESADALVENFRPSSRKSMLAIALASWFGAEAARAGGPVACPNISDQASIKLLGYLAQPDSGLSAMFGSQLRPRRALSISLTIYP